MEIKFDETIELAENAMLKIRPNLFDEWDFEKNVDLDIYKMTKGMGAVAWWNCPKCGSLYDNPVIIKVKTKPSSSCCPFGSGHRVNHTNSLASLRPDIAKEWHPALNCDLTPHDVTCYKNTEAWWLGECGHEWEAVISNRTNMKSNCPYCSNQKILVGFNDMWTTDPDLAKLLLNPEDGYKYTQMSGQKLDWKCLECNGRVNNKVVYSVREQGLSCPKCSDGIRFPEKFMCNLLKENDIEFEFDIKQDWSQGKRYDFYLPDYNWIIETHGGQHYDGGFERIGKAGRSLQVEQENDRFKEQLARDIGIDKYIVIDARYSTVEWMKNSILDSELIEIIYADNINFEKVGRLSSCSLIKVACDLWSKEMYTNLEISKLLHLDRNTITKYLKRGAEIGWCSYPAKKSKEIKIDKRTIVQLSQEGYFIREWKTAKEASLVISGKGASNLVLVCANKRVSALGFKWMYKTDYDKMITEEVPHEEYMSKYYPKKPKK